MVKPVNQELLDAAIRHSIYLERFKTHEVNKIIGMLNKDVIPDALSKLKTRLARIIRLGYDLGPETTRKLKDAIDAMNEIMRGGLKFAGKTLQKDMQKIALAEAAWQAKILQASTKGLLNYSFDMPSMPQLKSIITSKPMQGKLLKKWWGQLENWQQDEIHKQLNIGMAQGEGIKKLVSRIAGTRAAAYSNGTMGMLRRHVQANVRTAVSHVSNYAREAVYEANSDVIKEVEFVATLDSRTTDICMSLDGKVFPIGQGARPPMHHQCRSTTVPVTKSWKELGIELKEAPVSTRAARLYSAKGKAMMTGQVSEKVTYGAWLKKQNVPVQNQVLGVKRAGLFRSGRVKIDQFVDNKFRSLSYAELLKLEKVKVQAPAKKVIVSKEIKFDSDLKEVEKKFTVLKLKEKTQEMAAFVPGLEQSEYDLLWKKVFKTRRELRLIEKKVGLLGKQRVKRGIEKVILDNIKLVKVKESVESLVKTAYGLDKVKAKIAWSKLEEVYRELDKLKIINKGSFLKSSVKAIKKAKAELESLGYTSELLQTIKSPKKLIKGLTIFNGNKTLTKTKQVFLEKVESSYKKSNFYSQKQIKTRMQEIEKFILSVDDDIIERACLEEVDFKVVKSGRAFYEVNIKQIVVEKSDKADAFIHEFGHALSEAKGNQARWERLHTWGKARCKKAHKVDVGLFGEEELGYGDVFFDDYVGRIYMEQGEETLSELLSMGVQALSNKNDWVDLVEKDLDHLYLTWAFLRGY